MKGGHSVLTYHREERRSVVENLSLGPFIKKCNNKHAAVSLRGIVLELPFGKLEDIF